MVLRLKEAGKLYEKDSFMFSSVDKLVLTPGEMWLHSLLFQEDGREIH